MSLQRRTRVPPLDLLYPLHGENARAYHADLWALPPRYEETWVIRPQDAGFHWTVERRPLDEAVDVREVRGYQDLAYWPLTVYQGPNTQWVIVEPDGEDVVLVLRGDLLDTLRAQSWGGGAIDRYDWRVTFRGSHWQAEARRRGSETWNLLAESESDNTASGEIL